MKRIGWIADGALALAVIAGCINITSAQTTWHQALGIGGAVDVEQEGGTNSNVYAVVQGSGAGIYKSMNGGHTFSLLKVFTNPYKLLAGHGARLWAATSQGLYKTNNLSTWTAVTGGLPAGKSVSWVGVAAGSVQLYATVTTGTTAQRGLYRSLNSGVSWSRVIANANIRSIANLGGCGTGPFNTVFAGGSIASGGPACTLLKSTDGGATFACTTFPHIVNEAAMYCVVPISSTYDLYVTSPQGTPDEAVRRSTDGGVTFVDDGEGLLDVGATNTTDWHLATPGIKVGTSYAGVFERGFDPPLGATWTQFSTDGLLDLRINDWIMYDHEDPPYYVVATPTAVFAFDYFECPPPGDPNVACQ